MLPHSIATFRSTRSAIVSHESQGEDPPLRCGYAICLRSTMSRVKDDG